jgi:hypothetical protein
MRPLRLERSSEPVARWYVFLLRTVIYVGMALIVTLALVSGLAGLYYWFAHSPPSWCSELPPKPCSGPCWIEALHRASIMLSGKGLTGEPEADCERLLVFVYAVLSSPVLAGALGVVVIPFFHRVMHHFHQSDGEDKPTKRAKSNRGQQGGE